MYRDFGVSAKEICKDNNITMESVHLPTKDMNTDLVHEIMCLFNVEKATIHAHDNVLEMLMGELSWKVCLENFPYKSNRKYRTPIDIIYEVGKNKKLGMTLDICHAESFWMEPIILSSLLKYTDILHLSNKLWDKRPKDVEQQLYQHNRTGDTVGMHPLQIIKIAEEEAKDKDAGFHTPIHGYKGILNIDKILSIILKQFNWKGETVIEYMPKYFNKAVSDYYKLKKTWEKI